MLSGSQSSPTIGVRSCSLVVQQDQPLVACARALIEKASGAGHIKLWLPVFHIGYWKSMLSTLQCICKSCSSILLPEEGVQDLPQAHAVSLLPTVCCPGVVTYTVIA